MIDVIFLLLVFFVCTASFHAIERMLPTNMTLGAEATDVAVDVPKDFDEIIVEVFWHGDRPTWRINSRDYFTLIDVQVVLKALAEVAGAEPIPVILDIDPAVPMEHVIDISDLCRAVGLPLVQFAARAS